MRVAWVCLLVLSACNGAAPPPPPEPVACVPAPAPPVAPLPPKPVASVAKAYAATAQKETQAVTSPAATPEYVRDVHDADKAARHALAALEREGHAPTPSALDRARNAVRALGDALKNIP